MGKVCLGLSTEPGTGACLTHAPSLSSVICVKLSREKRSPDGQELAGMHSKTWVSSCR